jgi:hypothetical protein
LESGFAVIVDATFLTRAQRDLFAPLTQNRVILDVQASEDELRNNIGIREAAGTDASDATIRVMEHQMSNHEPLNQSEPTISMNWNAEIPLQELATRLKLGLQTA